MIKLILITALFLCFCGNVLSGNTPVVINPIHFDSLIRIKKVEIRGNTLLRDDELEHHVAHLTKGQHTFKALEDAANAIQQNYRDIGYGGVVAYIPVQEKLTDEKVIIQVMEGKIASIHINNNERFDKKNILTSLPHLQNKQTPLVKDIDRNIQLANENPAKEIKVSLMAGEKQEEINVEIDVKEERPLRLLMGVDTAGAPGTGAFRTNVGVQHANLWNRDHIGTFQFQTSPSEPEKVQIYSLGYRLPLYNKFSAIDFFYAHSNVDNVSTATPAGPLGFTGRGDVAGFRAHHYLSRIGEYDQRVIFGWDWRQFNNNCTVRVFGAAGCGQASSADVTIAPISLGYSGQIVGPKLSWGVNSAISGNLGGSSNNGFNIARLGAEKHYFVWRLFAFSSLNLPAGFGLAARVSAQYSPHALVPGEQFGIGGGGSAMGGFISVRGYREREVIGDYGSFINIEGLGPNLAKYSSYEKLGNVSLRPIVFFDFGWAGNHHSKECMAKDTSCTLAGVGGGIRLAVGKKFSSRLDVGHALLDGNRRSAGSNRIHLSVNFTY